MVKQLTRIRRSCLLCGCCWIGRSILCTVKFLFLPSRLERPENSVEIIDHRVSGIRVISNRIGHSVHSVPDLQSHHLPAYAGSKVYHPSIVDFPEQSVYRILNTCIGYTKSCVKSILQDSLLALLLARRCALLSWEWFAHFALRTELHVGQQDLLFLRSQEGLAPFYKSSGQGRLSSICSALGSWGLSVHVTFFERLLRFV